MRSLFMLILAASCYGQDIGAQINAACLKLPTSGGVIDLTSVAGAQTSTVDWFAGCSKPTTIILGAVTINAFVSGQNAWSIHLPSDTHIECSGPGVTIFRLADEQPQFGRVLETVIGVKNVSIKNCECDGNAANNTNPAQQNHCIMLDDCYRCEASGNFIHDTNGDGIMLHGSNLISDVMVSNNQFIDNRRTDISIISGQKVQVVNNRSDGGFGFESIHCEPDSTGEFDSHVLIEGNIIDTRGLAGGISCTAPVQGLDTKAHTVTIAHNDLIGGHILMQRIVDGIIDANHVSKATDLGGAIQAFGRHYRIIGNTVDGFAVAASSGFTGGIYHDCSSTNDTSGMPAGTGDSIIAGNTVTGASLNGIMDFNCSRDIISHNIVSNTQIARNNANGIRVLATIPGLSDRVQVTGNLSFDDQPTHTQKVGVFIDSGVTNARVTINDGTGNLNTVISDTGANTYLLGNAN